MGGISQLSVIEQVAWPVRTSEGMQQLDNNIMEMTTTTTQESPFKSATNDISGHTIKPSGSSDNKKGGERTNATGKVRMAILPIITSYLSLIPRHVMNKWLVLYLLPLTIFKVILGQI